MLTMLGQICTNAEGDVIFDPNIQIDDQIQGAIILCKPMPAQPDLLLSLFSDDQIWRGGQTVHPDDPDSEGMDIWEYVSDEASLYTSNLGHCTFNTQFSRYVMAVLDPLDGIYPQEDLPFASRDTATALCVGVLKSLGVEARPYYVASLDHTTLQQAYDKNAEYLAQLEATDWNPYIKRQWSEADACYFIKLRSYLGDLPVTSSSFSPIISTWSIPGSDIWIIVNNNGVAYLDTVGRLYSVVKEDSPQPLLNFDQAKELLLKWNRRIIGIDDVYIDEIRLEYRPNIAVGFTPEQRVEMTPAWVFCERIDIQHLVIHREYLTLNAFTGEVL